MDDDVKKSLTGLWLPALGVLAYALAGELSHAAWQRFGVPADRPGDSPPWYFIRQDYIDGIVMGAIGLVCVLIGLLALRRFRIYAGMLIWQSLLWFGGPAWQSMIILRRSDHVLDPASATTTWQSFDAYISDSLYWRGKVVIFLVVLLVAIATAAGPPSTWRFPGRGKAVNEPSGGSV